MNVASTSNVVNDEQPNQADESAWLLTESGWDAGKANYYETVFTIGNGRLGTRGSLEERHRGAMPGTFIAGVYDAADSPVTDLVNAPDWLLTEIYVGREKLDTDTQSVLHNQRILDLRTGILTRTTTFQDSIGRLSRLVTRRLASMAERDLCALRIEVTPLNHNAPIVVTVGIDSDRRNLERLPAYPQGTTFDHEHKWDKWARSTHLKDQECGFDGDISFVVTQTVESGIDIAYAYATVPDSEPVQRRVLRRRGFIGEELGFTGKAGHTIIIDKLVGIATSRDPGALNSPTERAVAVVATHLPAGYDGAAEASIQAWAMLWSDADCEVVGDDRAALALRFSIYHLLIAANPDDATVNIGAKSLSGEGYRGHVFWDTEIMMLPFYLYTQPRTARALLGYRHHTLPGARTVSAENGTGGARFPWESADTGLEECPISTPDGLNRFYTRDQEIHVSADVAFGIMEYVKATGDENFLFSHGAEVLFETSRFWVDRCEPDQIEAGAPLSLRCVMGPDEFHSDVDNNAFTNRLMQWQLDQAVLVYQQMADEHPNELAELAAKIGLSPAEPSEWADTARRIRVAALPNPGLIEQFDGYLERTDVPITEWDANNMPKYPIGYDHFNCETTMLLKQPDVVMLMFMFPDDYSLRTRIINYEFYEKRTVHKSSLSPSIHAIVGLEVGDSRMAEQYFHRSALVDLDDNQGNTEDGMHIASAGGTWQIAVRGFGGFRVSDDRIHFDPSLPKSWQQLRFSIRFGTAKVRVDLRHDECSFELVDSAAESLVIAVGTTEVELVLGNVQSIPTPVRMST